MMQLPGWLGQKRIGMARADVWARRAMALDVACALSLLSLGLTGCDSAPYERTMDGPKVYLDELSEPAKAEARQKIVESLNRGISAYDLGIGDEITILFHVDRKATSRQYAISAGDQLHVEFLGDAQNSQTVQVRPDGRISLPLIGAVMAAGQVPSALARQLQERYSGLLTEPKITVSVTQSHTPLDDFLEVLGSASKARSIGDKVLPDGTISLPLLAPLQARGLTLKDLERAIDLAYTAKGLDVFVSVLPSKLVANATLVIGEVGKPGRIELDRPTTVAMAVAQAGGITRSGATSAVRLFYIGDDGLPRVRSINLNEVLDDFRLEDDMIVPRDSIVYVPPTELAKTGRVVNAVLHDIIRFQGFSIGGAVIINQPTSSNTTVIPNSAPTPIK